MIVMAVVNQKGGVGKTTTAVNLAVGLAHEGSRVLLIDLDPQAHATLALGIDSENILAEQTVASLFYDRALPDIVRETRVPNLTLVPASIHLATAVEGLYSIMFREVRLQKALEAVRSEFDYVILDSGPNLGVLSINALVAANRVLIPTCLSMYSLDGLNALLNTLSQVKPSDAIDFDWRIVLTMVKGYGRERQVAAWKILEPLAERILATRIRETEAVEKSQMTEDEGQIMAVVLSRQAGNRGAKDYKDLVQEITSRWPA